LSGSNYAQNLVGCCGAVENERICGESIDNMSWDIVYRLVKQIPRGRVLSYGALAKALRLPGGARTAGRAMAATPTGKGIPWHRVVGERGKILIREPYASLQKKLLESEGVKITESRVDLNSHLWKPAKAGKKSAATKAAATKKGTVRGARR
jgi:methylated-DNA-protein-cysteine methyltransferase-like protein